MNGRNNPLPPQFMCARGGEWKPPSEFSQKQLKKWTQRVRYPNDGVTPANMGLICKEHSDPSQAMAATIKCQGPCSKRKPRDEFSKSQRNSPDAWCIQCTEWRLHQEGDAVPTAPPNADLSYDEKHIDPLEANDDEAPGNAYDPYADDEDNDDDNDDATHFSDGNDEDITRSVLKSVTRSIFRTSRIDDNDDNECDNDDNDAGISSAGNHLRAYPPVTSLNAGFKVKNGTPQGGTQTSSIAEGPKATRPSYASTASVVSNSTIQTPRQSVPVGIHSSTTPRGNQGAAWVPPHLRGRAPNPSKANSTATTSTRQEPTRPRPELRGMTGPSPITTNVPPHLRGKPPSVASTNSLAGVQSFASSTAASMGTNAAQQSTAQTYNAFDPNGEMHVQTTGGASGNGSDSTVSAGRRAIRVGRTGWPKGDNRKRFDVAPRFTSVPEERVATWDSSGSADEM